MTTTTLASASHTDSPRFGAALVAVIIAAALIALNVAAWRWTNPPVDAPDAPERARGVAYSGFQRHQDPTKQRYPSISELSADLERVATFADRIRTYSSTENAVVPSLAAAYGLRVTAGAWLDRLTDNNDLQIAGLIGVARQHRNIDRVIVGNEAILRQDLTAPELIAYIKRVKRSVRVPVSTAEPWHVWLRYPELARNVDFLVVHLLPYWEGLPAEHAVDYALSRYDQLQRRFPGKRIVIGEVGWPSRGNRVAGAIATPTAQAKFVREFLVRAQERGLDYYLMEMFDQPWKQATEGRAGGYWGLFHADRTPKFALEGPVEADPRWREKSFVSSLLAAPFMLWFAFAFRRFKPAGRIFFCALIQGGAAGYVWLATVPNAFYLEALEWTSVVLLLPASAAMLAVLIANGFEFAEVLWRRAWRREFLPAPRAADAPMPFVSIHLPASNEPPEMVILTLDSLAALDYPHFEVLVIDNNTRDERLWRPVEAHVARLGSRFRFIRLPHWPGFKAGALNFALRETDPRAEVIGVVDADYAVEPNWLRELVAHFDAPSVAVVQAPQAHREFEASAFRRMASYEFDGFFRIGMHHRNERNAIIQHGTMTLIRKSALERVGGWAEWCICEDAELGLRLMEAGCETRYVDAVLGRGLTPADFKAFKAQRFRWAFGAMQILKRHWRRLIGAGPLTAGQRYHFLTGWFSWFADALHLVFTLAALAWTIGALAFPHLFPLPLELYLGAVLVFLAGRCVLAPVLYRSRVRCRWRDVAGASLASMALSHAIASGVFEGLIRRTGTFKRTLKGANGHSRFKWLDAVREEALLAAAIAIAVAGLAIRFGSGHPEAMLWASVLALQALPYAAALACAWIAARGVRREHAQFALESALTVPAPAPVAPPAPAMAYARTRG